MDGYTRLTFSQPACLCLCGYVCVCVCVSTYAPVGGIGVVLEKQAGFISDIKQSHISGSENRTACFSTLALAASRPRTLRELLFLRGLSPESHG